jgi:hypothetical protein
MTHLRTAPRLSDPDEFYAALMEAHRALDSQASRKLDAKLILLLANHIGDMTVLREALVIAQGGKPEE